MSSPCICVTDKHFITEFFPYQNGKISLPGITSWLPSAGPGAGGVGEAGGGDQGWGAVEGEGGGASTGSDTRSDTGSGSASPVSGVSET